MLLANNYASVTIREIEYSIRIRDKDSSFSELLSLLQDELTAFRHNQRQNRSERGSVVHDFIQSNIERSIILRENTRVYLLNYKEREGSLRISFTLLIITNYVHFASLRQELDYYIKDSIAGYFEELLEKHIPVSVTVQSTDIEVATTSDSVMAKKRPQRTKRDILTRILAIAALSISILLTGLVVYNFLGRNDTPEKVSMDEMNIDSLLEQKIIEAVKDQKFTINLYKMVDTLNVDKSTIQVPAGK